MIRSANEEGLLLDFPRIKENEELFGSNINWDEEERKLNEEEQNNGEKKHPEK